VQGYLAVGFSSLKGLSLEYILISKAFCSQDENKTFKYRNKHFPFAELTELTGHFLHFPLSARVSRVAALSKSLLL
jgi:hypothetical protein